MTVSPQTQPRLPIHVEVLIYPQLARQAQIQGDVEVGAQIDSEGHVHAPIAETGPRILQLAAEVNLRTWRFQRGEDQELKVVYHFILKEGRESYPQSECTFDFPDSVVISSHPPPAILDNVPLGKSSHH
ncbi:MAG: energy transducer TonB [Acidobacteriia bacterium]|nr:energy transducer TonB [Terriglobia bacterium]